MCLKYCISFLWLSHFLLQDSWEFPLNFLAQYRAEFPIEFTLAVSWCDLDISCATNMSSGMLIFWYRAYHIYSTYQMMNYVPHISWILGISFDTYKPHGMSAVLVQNIWGLWYPPWYQTSLKSSTFPNILSHHVTFWFPVMVDLTFPISIMWWIVYPTADHSQATIPYGWPLSWCRLYNISNTYHLTKYLPYRP